MATFSEPFDGYIALRRAGLLHHAPTRRLDAGEDFGLDTPLAIVRTGICSVDGVVGFTKVRRHTVRLAESGDYVLPVESVSGLPARTIVTALTPSRVHIVSQTLLEAWLQIPAFAVPFSRSMLQLVSDMSARLTIALQPGVDTRLLLTLHALAEQFGKATVDGLRIDVRLTHQQLSSLIGSARESVTLALQRLVERGDLTQDGGTMTLRPILTPLPPSRAVD